MASAEALRSRMGGSRLARAQIAIDRCRGTPAIINGPADERLAALHVAGGEDAGTLVIHLLCNAPNLDPPRQRIRRPHRADHAGLAVQADEFADPVNGLDARAATHDLANEMVQGGLRAWLTCVDPRRLDASFAGRAFDHVLLADLPPTCDPCGENGEFHSFAWDGPMFRGPIPVRVGETVTRDGFVFADLDYTDGTSTDYTDYTD